MTRVSGWRGLGLALVFVVALALVVTATWGPPAPSPVAPGTFAFAALGDAPYYLWEDAQYPLVLADMAAHDLAWAVHVGDIYWTPCADAMMERSFAWFNRLPFPVVYTPGDNEWYDCGNPRTGKAVPLERLHRLRQIFFATPARSLGARQMGLATQGVQGPHAEFIENARWTYEGIVFATMHVIGSGNGTEPFPARGPKDDEATRLRTAAATAWLRETFEEAKAKRARAVVVFFHANMGLQRPLNDEHRLTFEPFVTALEEESVGFDRPVLAIHGDGHTYTVDHPLRNRATGQTLRDFTRVQVPGSPAVGWTRVTVPRGTGAVRFDFEARVVPRWKYW